MQNSTIIKVLAVVVTGLGAILAPAVGATFSDGGVVELSPAEIEAALAEPPAWHKEFGVERDWPVVLRDDEAIVLNGAGAKSAFTGTKWTGGVVYYQFDPNVNATNRQRFREATTDWSNAAALTFIQGRGNGSYIDVFSGDGNYSAVGMGTGSQPLSMYNWSYRYIIAHELGHALGQRHEQSRSDRDSYVSILTQNIEQRYAYNFDRRTTTNYGTYDFESVMHYRRNAFLKANLPSSYNTIEPKPAYSGFLNTMGNRARLSERDKLGMAGRYGDPGGGGGGGGGLAQLRDGGSTYWSLSHTIRYTGQPLKITGSVFNEGTSPASGFSVQFYASTNGSITSSDVFLGSKSINSLDPGRLTPIDTTVLIPYSLSDGNYFIGWIIDGGSVVSESNESDNAVINVNDLLTVPASGNTELSDRGGAYHGLSHVQRSPLQTLIVSGDVVNSGESAAAPFNVDFYASVNRTITSSDQFLGRAIFSGVQADSIAEIDTEVLIPETLAYGSYYIGYIIDSNNAVFEFDESDNTAYILSPRLTVSESEVDLVDGGSAAQSVSRLSVPAGEEFDLSFAVENVGTTSSGGFGMTFHISTDSQITSADRQVGEVRVDSLDGGESRTVDVEDLSIRPTESAGEYFLGWMIDSDGEVPEYDESSNTVLYHGGSQMLTVTVPLPPAVPGPVDASDGDFTNRVQLDWPNVLGATFYYVSRATSMDGTYTEIGTDLFKAEFADTTALQDKSYYYKVRSWRDFGGYSELSPAEHGVRSARVGTTFSGAELPWPVPGRIEAEDFDSNPGGSSDSDPANTGGKYRITESVDLEVTSDVGLGHHVDSTVAGEFTEYTVDVLEAGSYTLSLRVSAAAAGASLRVTSNGVDLTGALSVPATGDMAWTTLEVTGIVLAQGVQILRVEWIAGGAELNWIMVLPDSFAGSDLDHDADGVRTMDEFLLGLNPTDADSDGDGADDGVELAFGSDPLDAGSIYTAGLPSVSVNFTGVDSDPLVPNDLAPGDVAGMHARAFWHNVSSNSGSAQGLTDSAGGATSFGLSWTADEAGSRESAGVAVVDSADGAMFNGYLGTGENGVATIELGAVPYLTYDVIVYLDGASSGVPRHAQVALEETGLEFWLAETGDWSGDFRQALGDTAGLATPGANFVAFHNVTTPSIKLEVTAQGQSVSINGLQVIGHEPSALALTEFTELPGAVRLAFQTDAGRTYRVVTSTDLLEWEPVEGETGIAGDGGVVEREFGPVALPAGGGRRYYRVLLE